MKLRFRALPALALLGLTVLATPVRAQEAERAIPAAELREDLRVMRGALEESHVGLHWFTTKEELDRRFEEVSAALVRPMTAREFHRRLLPIVASIRHGHTTLSLPVEGVGYRLRHLAKEGRYLPFEVRVLEDRLYVLTDLSEGAEVGPGAEIVAIDGRPAGELLREMRRYLSADGANETFKTYQLGTGYQLHSLLDLLHGPAERYRLDVVPGPGEARTERVVAAQPPERMVALYRERTGREIDLYPPALGFEPLGDGVALLRVSSFYEGLIRPGEPGFEDFFASAFRRVRESGVTDLIVDVRGNEGGNGDYPPLLYSYLAHAPFRLSNPTLLASASMSYLPYAENPGDDLKAFAASPGDFVTRGADGSWVLKEEIDEERYRTYEPRADRFTGRLYVLTDGGSFSATNELVGLVYRYRRAEGKHVRFVGEENGGDNSSGRGSGGQTLRIVLPHSKQRLNIPLLGGIEQVRTNVPAAALPDHRVLPSIQDVIAGTDRQLLFVRELIARERAEGQAP